MPMLKLHEAIRVRQVGDSEWCYGTVVLVSANGVAAALKLNGVVRAGKGIVAGVLPLFVDKHAETVTGLTGHQYEIEVH